MRLRRLTLLLLASCPAAGPHRATDGRLALSADWAAVQRPGQLPTVTFENVSSQHTLLLLPNLAWVEFPQVSFTPYPGPPVDPHGRAFTLAPREKKTLEPVARGAWRFGSGRHAGSITYEVPSGSRRPDGVSEGELWVGRLRVEGTAVIP